MSGVLAAFTDAVGEAVNELSGFRFTRLTANVAKGVAVFPVETTFGWPTSGKAVIGGVVYSYTGKTVTTLTGVTFIDGVDVVVGAKVDYTVASVVVDFSRTYSAIDQTMRQFFVDTAVGEDLSIVGRNVGVDRPPGLEDDEVFRAIIKALAYTPKGTIFAIEAALTAFFGAGNFEVWENFPTSRNTVFIRILGGLFLATSIAGQAYLTRSEVRPLNMGSLETPLQNTPEFVQGVRLAPENLEQDFNALPTTLVETRYAGDIGATVWTYDVAVDEAIDNSIVDGVLRMVPVGDPGYFRPSRIIPESNAYFEVVLSMESGTSPPMFGSGWSFRILINDGEFEYGMRVSWDHFNGAVVFGTAGGPVLSVEVPTASLGQEVALGVSKVGDEISLSFNGIVFRTDLRTDFPASTSHGVRLQWQAGSSGAGSGPIRVRKAFLAASTVTDFWNLRGAAASTTNQNEVDLGEVVAVPPGTILRLFGGATAKNNDVWEVAADLGGGVLSLVGTPEKQLAIVESAFPTRVRIAGNARAFKYPDDVGKVMDLTGAQTGGNPGTYLILDILDPVSLLPYTGTNVEYGGTCVVDSATFVTETLIPWRLAPNFDIETPLSWELCGFGTVVGTTLTLPETIVFSEPIPIGYVIVVEVVYSQVKSAQLLAGREIANVGDGYGNFDYYPFYLPPNPLGPFTSFIDDLTVAGVIPEVSF